MLGKRTVLFTSAAVLALGLHTSAAWADSTITRETTTTTTDPSSGASGSMTVTKETTVQTPVAPPATETITTVPSPTETITTQTVVEPASPKPGTHVINFMDFDLNHDGVLSTREAGDMLFKLFDLDGNEVIDNKEYERKTVLTVVPMTKETTVRYDFGDGSSDHVEHTYDSFLQRTQLSRFDHNLDGLSPHEFTGKAFNLMDVNHDGVIDRKEWEGAYDATIDKQNKLDAELNK